jgi:hypothetical protein
MIVVTETVTSAISLSVVTEVYVRVSVMHPVREGAAVTDVLEYLDDVERALRIVSLVPLELLC